MTIERKEFSVKNKGYTLEGFTTAQDFMKTDFSPKKEEELVKACHKNIGEVFGDPNEFEKRIARHEKTDIQHPDTKKLYTNVIYTDDPEYYCRGSGGVGGGKVFWTPYTTKNKKLKQKIRYDDMCDNCKTTAHELQHGIGSHAEFDELSSIPCFLFRIDNLPKGERLEYKINTMYAISRGLLTKKHLEKWERRERNVFCSLAKRRPREIMKMLEEGGYDVEDLEESIQKLCKLKRKE